MLDTTINILHKTIHLIFSPAFLALAFVFIMAGGISLYAALYNPHRNDTLIEPTYEARTVYRRQLYTSIP